jgi:hypothetical protein
MRMIKALIFFHLSLSICYGGGFPKSLVPVSDADTVKESKGERRAFGNIKTDPLQLILSCEIPISFEVYLSQRSSLQVQAGYIFPARENSVRRGIYESYGENGNASTDGMFYYRNCPYNNDGAFDIKTEFRMFFNSVTQYDGVPHKSPYFALQFMYKYCYYDHLSVYLGSPYSYKQTESKKSSIYGFALVFGRQKYINRTLVTDLYGGIGFKISGINYTILGISPPQPPSSPHKVGQTGTENITSLYLSFGLRIGFEL